MFARWKAVTAVTLEADGFTPLPTGAIQMALAHKSETGIAVRQPLPDTYEYLIYYRGEGTETKDFSSIFTGFKAVPTPVSPRASVGRSLVPCCSVTLPPARIGFATTRSGPRALHSRSHEFHRFPFLLLVKDAHVLKRADLFQIRDRQQVRHQLRARKTPQVVREALQGRHPARRYESYESGILRISRA